MRKASKQILPGITLVTLLAVLCACQLVPTLTAPAQATLTVTTTATNQPQPTPTPPQAQATGTGLVTGTETSEPTITPPVPPTPIPNTWKSFTNAGQNVSLRYPENWRIETNTRASGPDGFFELSTRVYPSSEFDNLVNLCVLDANDPSLVSKYGPLPLISEWQGWDPERQTWIGYGCIVSPSEASGPQAVLLARDSRTEARNQILVMRADAAHFGGILSSLHFIKFNVPSPSTGYYDSPFCKETPKAAPVTTRQVGELLISEYAIANATCDPWKHFDGFQTRVMGLAMAVQRQTLRDRAYAARLADANRALTPFGYRMIAQAANQHTFELLNGTQVVASGFTNFRPVSVNAAGDDFILWLQDNYNSKAPVEVRLGGMRELSYWDEGFNTTWAGEDLISFDYSKKDLFPVGAPAQVEISSNGRKIQTISIPQMGPAGSPVHGLWSWQGHWVLDVAGVLFQDGEMQNPLMGTEEIFDWHLVNGRPFFLVRQGKSFGIFYDGQFLPARYDDIIHGDLCCDPARYAVEDLATGAVFYALKDGVWFLVSVQTAQ